MSDISTFGTQKLKINDEYTTDHDIIPKTSNFIKIFINENSHTHQLLTL